MLKISFTEEEVHTMLNVLRGHLSHTPAQVSAEEKLRRAVGRASSASKPHNPQADFGQTDGLNAATDAEAVESLK
jgi:hypothetical protein